MQTFSFRLFAGRLVLFALLAIGSAVIAEFSCRLLGDAASSDLEGLLAPFGRGSYKLRPQVDTAANWASGAFSVHTDSLGLRCDGSRRFAVRPGDQVDYMFVGDSQGFGNGVSYERTIVGALASNARAGSKIGNTSVGGHSALNQLELLNWLRDAQSVTAANYVILLTPVMINSPESYTTGVVGADGRLYDEVKTPMQRAVIWMKRNLVIYSRLRDAIRNMGIGVTPSGETPLVFSVFSATEDRSVSAGRLVGTLQKYEELARQQNGKLQLVYVPLTVEFDFTGIEEGAKKHGLTVDAARPFAVAQSAAKQLGLPLYDLRPTLKQLHESGVVLNLKGDFHYSGIVSEACGKQLWVEMKNY